MRGEGQPTPARLQGRQALFVVSLESRRMMGELSEGMLFDLGHADGLNPALAIPERAVPDGARAGQAAIEARTSPLVTMRPSYTLPPMGR